MKHLIPIDYELVRDLRLMGKYKEAKDLVILQKKQVKLARDIEFENIKVHNKLKSSIRIMGKYNKCKCGKNKFKKNEVCGMCNPKRKNK